MRWGEICFIIWNNCSRAGDGLIDRWVDKVNYKIRQIEQTDTWAERQRDRQAERQAGRQTDTHADRQAVLRTDRHTGTQAERQKQTCD